MPVLSITIADLRRHNACDLHRRVCDLEAHLGRSLMADEPIPLTTWAEVMPWTEDLIWALRVRPEGWPIAVEVALRAAERALPFAGAARSACEAAVETARGFLSGKFSRETLIEAANDANDAATGYAAHAVTHAAFAALYNDACRAARAARATWAAAYAALDPDAERALQRADLLEILRARDVAPRTKDLLQALYTHPAGRAIALEVACRAAERVADGCGVCLAAIAAARGLRSRAGVDIDYLWLTRWRDNAAWAAAHVYTATSPNTTTLWRVIEDVAEAARLAECAAPDPRAERALQRADLLELLAAHEV